MAIEQNDSVYLLCDHNGSFGAMATEYNDSVCLVCIEQNDSVYLLCDHNGSFGAMATEYNDSVCLVCICDRYGSKRNGLVDLL